MNRVLPRLIAVICGSLILFALITSNPAGQKVLEKMTSTLGASAYSLNGRYEVAVVLNYSEGSTFEWRETLSRNEYKNAEFLQKKFVKKYSKKALKALARKMGYFERLYGEQNTQMTAVQLAKVSVSDLRAERTTNLLIRN